jgi:hypothetical protein
LIVTAPSCPRSYEKLRYFFFSQLNFKTRELTHLSIPQHHRTPIELAIRARDDKICLRTSVLFFGALTLSLADGFGRADYGWARCYRGNDAKDHCKISHQNNLGIIPELFWKWDEVVTEGPALWLIHGK